ncbi:MAG: HDOD domain-containing protein [Sulfurimonas sp.]|nr:HDOD domain-containing protein [Sulfurimonas sp.]
MYNILIPESFPNLPRAMQKLQQMFASNTLESHVLVKSLEEDPLLYANILKLVNSPHYGLSNKVVSIHHSVMLLGSTIIRGIVMAAILKKSFLLDLSPYNITIETFDTICALRVKFLNIWLRDENMNIDMPTLTSAAFLMESGKIISANAIMSNHLKEKFVDMLNEKSAEEAEKIVLGIQSYTLAGKLFEKWEFEENFVDLISNIALPQTKEQQILHILSLLINTQGIFTPDRIETATELLVSYDMDKEKLQNAIKTIQKELA